jgi:hypothetical protein
MRRFGWKFGMELFEFVFDYGGYGGDVKVSEEDGIV